MESLLPRIFYLSAPATNLPCPSMVPRPTHVPPDGQPCTHCLRYEYRSFAASSFSGDRRAAANSRAAARIHTMRSPRPKGCRLLLSWGSFRERERERDYIMYMYIYIYMCIERQRYIIMYIYIYIHTHTYICVCINKFDNYY